MNALNPKSIKRSILIAGFFCLIQCMPFMHYGADEEGEVQYRSVDTVRWKEITKDLDYSADAVDRKESSSNRRVSINQDYVKGILYIMIAGLLIFFISYFIKSQRRGNNTEADDEFAFSVEDDEIIRSDLEGLLETALADKNYRMAIRLQYLIIIRQLSERELIDWQKEKTNKDYLREMRSHPHYHTFADITKLFNRVWYGDIVLNEVQYDILSPDFRSFPELLQEPVAEVEEADTTNSENTEAQQ